MSRLPQIITVIVLTLVFQPSSGQNYSPSKEELKVLKAEIKARTRENKHKLDENLMELTKRGYPLQHWDWITNSSLKILLAMDDTMIVMQSELDSRIQGLKNSDLISDMNDDDQFRGMYAEFTKRLSRLRKQYYSSVTPGSSIDNDWYLQQVLTFNKPGDAEKIKTLEQKLLNRKQLNEQRDKLLAEREQKQEEQDKQRQETIRAEQEEGRINEEREQERIKKRDAEISQLPSKAEIKSKFKTYNHKTGYVFEMFPVGFTPKQNRSTYDKVQMYAVYKLLVH